MPFLVWTGSNRLGHIRNWKLPPFGLEVSKWKVENILYPILMYTFSNYLQNFACPHRPVLSPFKDCLGSSCKSGGPTSVHWCESKCGLVDHELMAWIVTEIKQDNSWFLQYFNCRFCHICVVEHILTYPRRKCYNFEQLLIIFTNSVMHKSKFWTCASTRSPRENDARTFLSQVQQFPLQMVQWNAFEIIGNGSVFEGPSRGSFIRLLVQKCNSFYTQTFTTKMQFKWGLILNGDRYRFHHCVTLGSNPSVCFVKRTASWRSQHYGRWCEFSIYEEHADF